MKRLFLCGNTGTRNRGCEAIVRSTVKVLGLRSGDIYLSTFAPVSDSVVAKKLGINLLTYNSYPSKLHRYFYGAVKKLTGNYCAGQSHIQKPIFSRITDKDICLNIGGDTYCYGRPTVSYALNSYTNKHGIDNILWCCSVEPSAIDNEMRKDLNRYKYIFAREIITHDSLIEAGIDKSKVVKCCDPAFFLDVKETDLPKGFKVKNTVGINVSPVTVNEKNPHVYTNVIALIRHILDNTDMSVCLIPHVYDIKDNYGDYPILKKIYEEINDPRVSMVDGEYDCEELKYIISQCRFFVGARTHSTIAAYSSFVPTLVIGYSVKSKGIATDLFGGHEGYVVSYTDLTDKNELLDAFIGIVSKENELRDRLESFVPEYRKELSEAVKNYLPLDKAEKEFDICAKELCSGCSACASMCPVGAIAMKADEEGFLYPLIDYSRCIGCNKCRNSCPVAVRHKDTGIEPEVYSCINRDTDIRDNSSSGGVFTALAESVINEGGVVFGAAFTEDMRVEHIMCDTLEELGKLRGSKYVQSRIGDCYKQAKDLLEQGKKVLFSGTPCQIGGLAAYLGKEYDNLITVDMICHGVPSPLAWKKYIEQREKQAGGRCVSASLRNKSTGWRSYSVKLGFDNNTGYSCINTKDSYIKGFVANLYLRSSCALCASKELHRSSDITLGDFWGITQDSAFNDNKGASLLMLHSCKAKALFDTVNDGISCEKISFKDAVKSNPSYLSSSKPSPFRAGFFRSIKTRGFDGSVEKYYGRGYTAKLRRALKKIFR
ncbi:MAG: polysaccharide pyruvyl transferase family protein [Clostridia bacterium]|nr:polysaccharide pyruvyl transferase family protein [Clostridia bacterium]